jgi:hypothetical protein
MRLPVRFSVSLLAATVLAVFAGARIHAQSQPSQDSSSQTAPTQVPTDQSTGNGTYISIDPLAKVRYDNRFDASLGMAYDHMKAGPTLLQGSNLGGLDAATLAPAALLRTLPTM